MISYEKARMGKKMMKQFIAEGELEKNGVYRAYIPDADPDRGCGNAAEK